MTLIVKDVSKRAADRWLLRDVSFEVVPGEVFGICSDDVEALDMLLRLIKDEAASDGGTISASSKDVYLKNEISKGFMSRVFSSAGDGKERQDLKTVEMATDSGRKILLFDRTFCGSDPATRTLCFRRLREDAAERGLCVVYAASDFADVFDVCDRVALIENSYLIQTGTPQELYDLPETSAAARMTGRNNLFEARRLTSSRSEDPQYLTIDGEHRLTVQKIERSALAPLNQNMLLGIRPEQISISFGASFPEDNLIKASIAGIRPRGATTLVDLNAGGLRLCAMVLRLVGLNVGDECMLGLPPDRIKVFKN